MSDQPDCRPYRERDHILRRTFAWRFRQREDAEALTRLGEILQEWMYETNQFGPDEEAELPAADLAAAGADLLLVADFLEQIARERFDCGLGEDEVRRCERAEGWAEQARALGEIIRRDCAQAGGDGLETSL
jgi:hypothetical protein